LTVSVQQDGSAANTWLILAWNTNGTQGELRIAHEGTHIENFTFQDGVTQNLDQVIQALIGAVLDTPDAGEGDIVGTDQRDVLRGASNDDVIFGGAGNDLLDGKDGADTVYGGAGNDRIFVDHIDDVIVEVEGGGYEWVSTSVSRTLEDHVDSATAIGDAEVYLRGNDLDNWLVGNEQSNVLRGLDGQDRLRGESGNDILDGGRGADVLEGGAGDDRIFVDHIDDVIVEVEGGGYEWVSTSVSRSLEANVESATALGTTEIDLTGNILDNWLIGNAASNVLSGRDGNDRLEGREGADTLIGGQGTDILTGGSGADVFFFEIGDGADNIRDFSVSEDTLAFGAGLSLADLTIIRAGQNTQVLYGSDLIVLEGVTDFDPAALDFQS
ncbi:MAG: calcium-binding protein, partial [Pseudomonadota bacterium]